MFTLEDYLTSFTGSLIPHAVLAVYLFVIMGTRGRCVLKKLPALLLSPLLAVLLAGLSKQADEGEMDQLRAALSELDAGFDRRIGENIQASTQIGNVRVPQVRSLLLSKLVAMGEQKIDCRMEVLYVDLKDGAWDGFTLRRELRRRDPHGTLVYITSYGDLAWKNLEVYTNGKRSQEIYPEGRI